MLSMTCAGPSSHVATQSFTRVYVGVADVLLSCRCLLGEYGVTTHHHSHAGHTKNVRIALQRDNAHITRFKSSKSNHDCQLPQGPGCYPHLKHRGKRKVDRNQLDRSHNQHHHPHHIMV